VVVFSRRAGLDYGGRSHVARMEGAAQIFLRTFHFLKARSGRCTSLVYSMKTTEKDSLKHWRCVLILCIIPC